MVLLKTTLKTPRVPHLLHSMQSRYILCSSLRHDYTERDELGARRNPMLLLRLDGELLLRLATRQFVALLFQLPPRLTRLEPYENVLFISFRSNDFVLAFCINECIAVNRCRHSLSVNSQEVNKRFRTFILCPYRCLLRWLRRMENGYTTYPNQGIPKDVLLITKACVSSFRSQHILSFSKFALSFSSS